MPANIILGSVRDIVPAEQALIDAGVVRLISPRPDFATELMDAITGSPVYVRLNCVVSTSALFLPTTSTRTG